MNVNDSNKVVMIMWLASPWWHFDICETLPINFDCVWAPSFKVVNTESTSPPTAVVLRSVTSARQPGTLPIEWNSLIWDVVVETVSPSAQRPLMSCCMASLSPILYISISCDQTLARSRALNQAGSAWLLFQLSSSLEQCSRSGWMVARHHGPWWSQSPLHLI